MPQAGSEEIVALRVDRNGRPQPVGDPVPTGTGTGPSPVMFAPDGRTAYVLNRGNNTVAAYRMSADGGLRLLGSAPSGDAFGLALAPDGSSLFAANQSGTVSAYAIADDGTPRPAGEPVPTCFGVAATKMGSPGDDVFWGTPGDDVIVSRGGDDRIRPSAGDDLICSGPGADRLAGGAGNDRLDGGFGHDVLFGGLGDDELVGGGSPDVCFQDSGSGTKASCEPQLFAYPLKPTTAGRYGP